MKTDKASFDVTIRYFDLDANKHVNNSVYFTYMEEARTQLLLDQFLEWGKEGIYFIVTEASCKYKKQITFLDKVSIKLSIENIKGVSFEINYRFVDPSGQEYAQGKTRMACINEKTGRLYRLPQDGIEYLEKFSV